MTTITLARKEILVDPYRVVYEDTTPDFSLTNLTGYITSVTEVADISTRNGLTPTNGQVVEVVDASADNATYARKRYYWTGTAWQITDNVRREEIALFAKAVIHKSTGDVEVDLTSAYDPETVSEFTFDYDEDGWYEVTVNGVLYKSVLNQSATLEGIFPNGAVNDLTWDESSNQLQVITSVNEGIDFYGVSNVANTAAFDATYEVDYSATLEDVLYEYLSDCKRSSFDVYMDETYKNGNSKESLRLFDNYINILSTEQSVCTGVAQGLYAEVQKILERAKLDCDCLLS